MTMPTPTYSRADLESSIPGSRKLGVGTRPQPSGREAAGPARAPQNASPYGGTDEHQNEVRHKTTKQGISLSRDMPPEPDQQRC